MDLLVKAIEVRESILFTNSLENTSDLLRSLPKVIARFVSLVLIVLILEV
jgi:hypothetical protein